MTGNAPRPRRRRPVDPVHTRRRLVAVVALIAAFAAGWAIVHATMPAWYARHWYRLDHEQIIRTHAAAQKLAPDLVAAVIWRESNFDPDARSSEGAVGLMQVLPDTAEWIATQPNPPAYPASRLAEPEVNVAFGTWYLHYLLDKYGVEVVAIAAYNGGETNAAAWAREAGMKGRRLAVEDIPFPETRAFVRSVTEARAIYRRVYARELGIAESRVP